MVNKVNSSKKCPKCGRFLPLTREYFSIRNADPSGFNYMCKECRSKMRREKSIKKGIKVRSQDPLNKKCPQCGNIYPRTLKYFHNHKRNCKDNLDCWCINCCKKKSKERYRKTRDTEIEQERRRYFHKKRYEEKYDEILKYTNQYRRNRYTNDPEYRIHTLLNSRLKQALKGQLRADTTRNLLGCTIDEFKEYIASKFEEGMTWENHGQRTWHLDHRIPCAAFDLTDLEQQKQCFHYTNLQPMWRKENQEKTCYYNGDLYKNGIKVTQL